MSLLRLGVDLGGTNIAAALVDENGALHHRKSVGTRVDAGVFGIASDIAKLVQELVATVGEDRKISPDIGIGVPSIVHPKTRVVVHANNLGWIDVDLKKHLLPLLPDYKIHLGNDADCATLAESRFGVLKGYDNGLFLTLGTGLGGGFIYHGELFTGGLGFSFEPGHNTLVLDGDHCTCGRKGCLEAYVSSGALRREVDKRLNAGEPSVLKAEGGDPYTIRDIFDASDAGDPVAVWVIDRYVYHLAAGLANYINIFQPDIVAIGGGISKRGEAFYRRINEEVERALDWMAPFVKREVMPAKLGNDAGIIGAALLATDPSYQG